MDALLSLPPFIYDPVRLIPHLCNCSFRKAFLNLNFAPEACLGLKDTEPVTHTHRVLPLCSPGPAGCSSPGSPAERVQGEEGAVMPVLQAAPALLLPVSTLGPSQLGLPGALALAPRTEEDPDTHTSPTGTATLAALASGLWGLLPETGLYRAPCPNPSRPRVSLLPAPQADGVVWTEAPQPFASVFTHLSCGRRLPSRRAPAPAGTPCLPSWPWGGNGPLPQSCGLPAACPSLLKSSSGHLWRSLRMDTCKVLLLSWSLSAHWLGPASSTLPLSSALLCSLLPDAMDGKFVSQTHM